MSNASTVPVYGSTSEIGSDSSEHTSNSTPLSISERAAHVEMLMANIGLNRAQAQKFIDGMEPGQARTFLALMDGSGSITREQAINQWGLTRDEANMLFPEGKVISSFTNPFSRAFTMFLMLTYSLELDLKQMLSDVLQTQKDEAIAKADKAFEGAIVQFTFALTAAVVTGGFACKGIQRSNQLLKQQQSDPKKPGTSDPNRGNEAAENTWYSPIGASLVTQPINAAGEFGNAYLQRDSMYHDANAEEARGIYQQLMSTYDSAAQLSRAAAEGH